MKKVLMLLMFVLLGAALFWGRDYFYACRTLLNCGSEVLVIKKDDNHEDVTLSGDLHVFFNRDGKGFLRFIGVITQGKQSYQVNRERKFNYYDRNKNGIYTYTVTRETHNFKDTVPARLWEMFFPPPEPQAHYYISFYKIDSGLYVINDLNRPLGFCKRF